MYRRFWYCSTGCGTRPNSSASLTTGLPVSLSSGIPEGFTRPFGSAPVTLAAVMFTKPGTTRRDDDALVFPVASAASTSGYRSRSLKPFAYEYRSARESSMMLKTGLLARVPTCVKSGRAAHTKDCRCSHGRRDAHMFDTVFCTSATTLVLPSLAFRYGTRSFSSSERNNLCTRTSTTRFSLPTYSGSMVTTQLRLFAAAAQPEPASPSPLFASIMKRKCSSFMSMATSSVSLHRRTVS
mmetsp:Transcript_10790/g.34250  ORF Transcript_10790/g.34250 Transcript_10790/m.34250 type:complete len:239 (+) Transcript_10790:526-1242(+)